jgi:hypothetical protein
MLCAIGQFLPLSVPVSTICTKSMAPDDLIHQVRQDRETLRFWTVTLFRVFQMGYVLCQIQHPRGTPRDTQIWLLSQGQLQPGLQWVRTHLELCMTAHGL